MFCMYHFGAKIHAVGVIQPFNENKSFNVGIILIAIQYLSVYVFDVAMCSVLQLNSIIDFHKFILFFSSNAGEEMLSK